MEVQVAGIKTTLVALRKQGADADGIAQSVAEAMGQALISQVRKNVTRTRHSLGSLAGRDHPYARRHGTIRASALGGRFSRQPYLVHTRSGQMVSSLRGSPIKSQGGAGYEVSVSGAHATFVVRGTKKMLRRDVLVDTANMRATRKLMTREAILELGRRLRAAATIRGFRIAQMPSTTER